MDNQLQIVKRAAFANPDDNGAVWSYVRALERSSGLDVAPSPGDLVVPFHWYRRVAQGRRIIDQPETLDGMTVAFMDYRGPANSTSEFIEHYLPDLDGEVYDHNIDVFINERSRICGYAVIDRAVFNLANFKFSNLRFTAGSDAAADAIANYKLALMVANAHTVVHWKYYLDDYDSREASGYMHWEG